MEQEWGENISLLQANSNFKQPNIYYFREKNITRLKCFLRHFLQCTETLLR